MGPGDGQRVGAAAGLPVPCSPRWWSLPDPLHRASPFSAISKVPARVTMAGREAETSRGQK